MQTNNTVVMTFSSCETFFLNQASPAEVLTYCRLDWVNAFILVLMDQNTNNHILGQRHRFCSPELPSHSERSWWKLRRRSRHVVYPVSFSSTILYGILLISMTGFNTPNSCKRWSWRWHERRNSYISLGQYLCQVNHPTQEIEYQILHVISL